MNKANLLRVADAIEKQKIKDLGYNQKRWVARGIHDMSGRDCGTTACIAGYAFAIATGRNPDLVDDVEIPSCAQRFLELTFKELKLLFDADHRYNAKAVAAAVATLRYAAEHNVVDWEAAQVWAANQSEVQP